MYIENTTLLLTLESGIPVAVYQAEVTENVPVNFT
jgi:hypothetical protein